MDNKMTLIKERFANDQTDNEVDGITIIIDGKIKEAFDIILNMSPDYKDYTEVVRDAIIYGTKHIIESNK